jgi:PAS domain S-box-containing protein
MDGSTGGRHPVGDTVWRGGRRLPDPVRVLMVEDSDADALLLEEQLRREGFDLRLERVQTGPALREALDRGWDVVLADYSMPGFGALPALAVVKERAPDLPFIVVSGSVGDAALVAAMRAGASDYVLKGNLSRLAAAIRRELADAEQNRARRSEERARREAEERFRFVVERTGEVLYRLRFDTMTYDYISPGIARLTGYAPEEINELGFFSRVVAMARPASGPLPHARVQPPLEDAPAGEFWADYQVLTRSGELRWLANHSFPWHDEEGRLLGSVGVLSDITERKRAEEALRQSAERFRLVAMVTNDVLWDWDVAKERVSWTEGLRAWGYDPAEASEDDQWWHERVHPEDLAAAESDLDEAIAAGQSWTAEYRFRRADGTFAHVYDRGYVIRDEAGRAVRMTGAMMDISERRRLELQLVQAQKMEAVGRLAGGVAHDFNNIVTAIRGYGELALRRLEPESPLRHYLEEIIRAGDRAASVTQQLLAFSRTQLLQPRVLDLRTVVRDVEGLLRRLLGEDVELTTLAPASLGRVRADPVQVEQVLMNLAINARDAMPQGGRLVIETTDVEMDRTSVREGVTVEAGRYVMLAVSDTGHGMDKATQARVFEPFFTTKEVGKGTGLGLSTVYGIVQQSGGYVWLYSEVGRGTTFKICLPRVEAAAEPATAAPPAPSLPRGAGTLLIVEDEDGVRELLQELLESAGYHVLAAERPSVALQVAESHAGHIDLLISDVILPEMTGPDLARELAARRPAMKVLFLSGYTPGIIADKGYAAVEEQFLQKPFTADALEAKVREILAEVERA